MRFLYLILQQFNELQAGGEGGDAMLAYKF